MEDESSSVTAAGEHESPVESADSAVTTLAPAEPEGVVGAENAARSAGPAARLRRVLDRGRTWWLDSAVILVCLGFYTRSGWSRRWITDDGLIFLRPVRQVVAGNGPVFNAGERVETSTSTLWQWLLVLADVLTGGDRDLCRIAVLLGLALACLGVLIALDSCRKLVRASNPGRTPLIPLGILAVLVLPPFWVFATSGLETGLELFWIALAWRLLVAAYLLVKSGSGTIRRRRLVASAVFLGLGPLVRPDLGLTMAVFLVALVAIAGFTWRRALAALLAAGFLPAAYQVFRMGYYGLLVPMPGVTKEAGADLWWRGIVYFANFEKPYAMWFPAVLALAFGVGYVWRTRPSRRLLAVVAAPMVAAFLQAVYVLKVGGDFMHGRMWIPVVLLGLLPMLLVPLTRLTAPAVVGFAAWTAFGVADFPTAYKWTPSAHGKNLWYVWDEHQIYVERTGHEHPDSALIHVRAGDLASHRYQINKALATGRRVLVFDPNYIGQPDVPLAPGTGGRVASVIGTLGVAGYLVPLDGYVVDVWGLSNTIGAHMDIPVRGAAGHEKLLPEVWNLALYADPADDAVTVQTAARGGVRAQDLAAARHTLQCGAVKDLLDSIEKPMTFGRFWSNLTGSFDHTSLRIPADPVAAEKKFCG
ncbi:MAG: hypothetical protein HOV83_02425 [Catenulispora sp.]|nr:hypothetical protein [Catenulispora sp.]